MESQPQNPEFSDNPKSFHPAKYVDYFDSHVNKTSVYY